jgi:hypothetical protein
LKVIEVGSNKNDPRGNGRGKDANANRNAGMQPNPSRLDWTLYRGFESQKTL